MAKKHNIAAATRYLNLIDQTKTKPDLDVCFAVGTIGKSDTVVVLFKAKGLNSLSGALKNMDYKEKKDKDYQKAEGFSLLRRGTGHLNDQGKFVVRLAQGGKIGFQTLEKRMKEYFKGFGKRPPDMEEQQGVGEITDDEIQAFELKAAENAKYFSDDDDDEPGQPAVAAEQPSPPVDEDVEAEAPSSDLTSEASDARDQDEPDEPVPEENRAEAVEEPASEDEEDDNDLSDELKTGIAAESAKIAAHALGLSRQIGAGQKAEQDPLMGKIADRLADMLAATPLEERETALHNFTSRLLLMLAYPENLRNLQYVDESQTADRWKKYGADAKTNADREKVLVNGIDLDSVPTDDLDQTEVTEALVNLAKAQAKERLLPYPVSQVRPEDTPIATIVASGWPKQEGQAAARRQVIERLITAMKQKFGTDDQLIGLLGFKKGNPAQGDELVASLVDSIRDVWEARRGSAIKQTDEVKRKVNQMVPVEALGGTWQRVDELFLRIDGEISDQLSAIGGQGGEARSKAIELVAGTVQSSLDYLSSNPIVGLLNDPPSELGQGGGIGETLREGLDGVSKGLKRIESSGAGAGA